MNRGHLEIPRDGKRKGPRPARLGVGAPALLLLPLALLLLEACATASSSDRASGAVPSWMAHYPVDSGYFVGIGGSPDTGDRQGDLERAQAKALAQLASEIEVSVRSDQTFRETESENRGATTTAEIIVRTLSSQKLQGVELVDTFHSTKEGYWFYYRLSKRTWDGIKNREMYELRDRVLASVAQAEGPGAGLAERIRSYAFGLKLLEGSLYAGRISAELGGSRGVLDDLLKARLRGLLSATTVAVESSAARFVPGRDVEVRVAVRTREGIAAGVLPLEIRGPDGSLLASMRTNGDGVFIGRVRLGALKTGSRECTVALADEVLQGVDRDLATAAPRAPLAVEVLPLGVHLRVTSPAGLDAQWLSDSLASILTQRFAVTVLRQEADSPFVIAFAVRSRNAPKNDYGIEIAYCSLSMTVTRADSQIAAVTTGESKGAGLTPEQAERNAAKGMLQDFANDSRLGEAVAALEASAGSEKP